MSKKFVRKWIRPYLRKNNKRCKKKFSRVRGHFIKVYIKCAESETKESINKSGGK